MSRLRAPVDSSCISTASLSIQYHTGTAATAVKWRIAKPTGKYLGPVIMA